MVRLSRAYARLAWLVVPVLLLGVSQAVTSRAQSQQTVVSLGGFELRCPSSVNEGTTASCTLSNLGEAAAPWPVVAIVHLSTDANRAFVRGSPLDVRTGTQSPSADMDGGVDWVGDTLVAYSRFDWSGDAPAAGADGDSRNVQIVIEADDDYEAEELFYVSLAPDGRTALGPLLDNSGAVRIANTDTKTNDARLADLEMSGGASVAFLSDVASYAVTVPYDVTEMVLTPTANHKRAAVTVAGTGEGGGLGTGKQSVLSGEGSHALPLDAGVTTLQVEVTAEDGTTKTYTIEVTRAVRPSSVTVESGSFRLECPAAATEGSDLTCTLSNASSLAQPWPAVAILHSSANRKRALITEDPLLPDTDPTYSRDLLLADPQTPAADNYNYGYGELFSGESRHIHTVYGYENFDWDGDAGPNESRSVVIRPVDDETAEGSEVFYVSLAPSGYAGLTGLTRNKAPIIVSDADASLQQVSVVAVDRTEATVSVQVSDALTGDRAHLRYRVSGSWTVAGPEPVTAGVARFGLSGLDPGAVYVLEASLNDAFTTTVTSQLTTLADASLQQVSVVAVDRTEATVSVQVSDALTGDRAHLRYRVSGSWTVAGPEPVTAGVARFGLSGLDPGAVYMLEASLNAAFTTTVTSQLTTLADASLQQVSVVAVDRTEATVSVQVSDTLTGDRAHLRYRVSGSWTVAGPEPVTAGVARFGLSGLDPGAVYMLEASLNDAFTTTVTSQLTTLADASLQQVSVVAADRTEATVSVQVSDALTGDRANLRYRVSGSQGAWTVAGPEPVTAGVARFSLSGLDPGTVYVLEASLDAAFTTTVTGQLMTLAGASLERVSVVAADRTEATVSVQVSDALTSDRAHLRYRVSGSQGAWTVAGPEPVTAGVARFSLSGLDPGTVYVLEASLDAAFTTTVTGQLTTLAGASLERVSVVAADRTEATVSVQVSDALTGDRAHLRYRVSGSQGAWTLAGPEPVTAGVARFSLSGLDPGTVYVLEASLDAAFTTTVTGQLMTLAGASLERVSVVAADRTEATVSVQVSDALTGDRAHLRYRVSGSQGAWTLAGPEPVTAGVARFSLSGLDPGTVYVLEASLDAAFTTTVTGQLMTLDDLSPQTGGGGGSDDGGSDDGGSDDGGSDDGGSDDGGSDDGGSDDGGSDDGGSDDGGSDDGGSDDGGSDDGGSDDGGSDDGGSDDGGSDDGGSDDGGSDDGGSDDGGSDDGGSDDGGSDSGEPLEERSDELPDVTAVFSDVDADAWYRPALAWALDRGVTRGCRDDLFCPANPVSRRQFVTLLWRAAGEPVPSRLGTEIFSDVTEGSYADAAIGWAAQEKITFGCSRGPGDESERRFCPSATATRAHLVVFLYRYSGGDGADASSTFVDVPLDSYFAPAVGWAVRHGITTGCDAERFCPAAPATRTHAVVFLHRMADLLGSFDGTPQSTGDAP